VTVTTKPLDRPDRLAPTKLRRSLILGAVAVTFGFTWLFGMFGLGRATEDLCFDDFPPGSGYGGYTMSVQSWPPSLVCHMKGRDLPDLIVHHYRWGAFSAVWTAAAPPMMLVAAIVLGIALRRYPPLPINAPLVPGGIELPPCR
jgi:hypothetical protein